MPSHARARRTRPLATQGLGTGRPAESTHVPCAELGKRARGASPYPRAATSGRAVCAHANKHGAANIHKRAGCDARATRASSGPRASWGDVGERICVHIAIGQHHPGKLGALPCSKQWPSERSHPLERSSCLNTDWRFGRPQVEKMGACSSRAQHSGAARGGTTYASMKHARYAVVGIYLGREGNAPGSGPRCWANASSRGASGLPRALGQRRPRTASDGRAAILSGCLLQAATAAECR